MQALNISESQLQRLIPCLLITAPAGDKWIHKLDDDSSVIVGSGPSCGIQLEGDGIDSMHCMLNVAEDGVWIRSWIDTSQSALNGEPLNDLVQFNSGDCVKLGEFQIVALFDKDTGMAKLTELLNEETILCDSPEILGGDDQENCDSPCDDNLKRISDIGCMPANESSEFDVHDVDIAIPSIASAEAIGDATLHDDTTASFGGVELTEDRLSKSLEKIAGLEATIVDYEDKLGSQSPPQTEQYEQLDFDESEVELLREEVSFLQSEIAERDAQIREISCTQQPASTPFKDSEDSEEVSRLVIRLEELLDELEATDKRIESLENVLKASDELNQAEQEERHQLESWVNNIESLVAQRESEWLAEKERLVKAFAELKDKNKKTEDMLLHSRQGGATAAETNLVTELRSENDQLRQKTVELELKCDALNREMDELDVDAEEIKSVEDIQREMQEMQLEISRERSAMARQKADVARIRNELEQQLDGARAVVPSNDADRRLHAMRQHLKEIHDTEQIEKKERSLGARISRLWQRLDGR